MAYNWTEVTNELMTNLYLYGQNTTPADLASDKWIRPADDMATQSDNIHIDIDITGFMTEGPGRFAFAALSPLVQRFLGAIPISVTNFPPGTETATGGHSLTAEQLYIAMGIPSGVGISTENPNNPTQRIFVHEGFTIRQSNYLDNNFSDVGSRTYIYHSENFGFSPDTRFVIEANGARHITNLKIIPLQDNFDFAGAGGITGNGPISDFAEAQVDPSGIGRKVYMNYVNLGSLPTIPDYTGDDFTLDNLKQIGVFAPLIAVPASLAANEAIVAGMFSDDVISFLDGNKPILYGTDGDDYTLSESNITLASKPFLFYNKENGVVIVAGNGDDVLVGGDHADKLLGGSDSDILKGGKGNDTLEGGEGTDTYIYTTGDGFDAIADIKAA